MLLGIWLFLSTSANAKSDKLPLSGNNTNDIRLDIKGYPVSFRLVDKKGVVRFQVISRGSATLSAANGVANASSHLVIASIHDKEWRLHTYKRFPNLVLRVLPVKTKSGSVLRVWISPDDFFDIDLRFSDELTFEVVKTPEDSTSDDG